MNLLHGFSSQTSWYYSSLTSEYHVMLHTQFISHWEERSHFLLDLCFCPQAIPAEYSASRTGVCRLFLFHLSSEMGKYCVMLMVSISAWTDPSSAHSGRFALVSLSATCISIPGTNTTSMSYCCLNSILCTLLGGLANGFFGMVCRGLWSVQLHFLPDVYWWNDFQIDHA